MSPQKLIADYDPRVRITDFSMLETSGDAALIGNWFVFLQADWFNRAGITQILEAAGNMEVPTRATVMFRGKQEIRLPGAQIAPTPLPTATLVAVTCDKALYRAQRDTVRLLIAAPQLSRAELTLHLRLSGNPYANYPLTLDEYGLCLWSMAGLPEGEYEAEIEGAEGAITTASAGACRFEVAEYRLAPLNAELAEQQLSGDTLRYTLVVTAFGQVYSGSIEVELQERGQRIGKREQLTCNREGQCRGVAKLSGKGPYTLSVFAGERSASVALKGAEQERRETMVISALGEERLLSLLPLPQSNQCRGMYIARGGVNNEPFLVRRVISNEVEITPRVDAEVLRVVVVNPARNTMEEKLYSNVKANESLRQPIPAPYGIVLLGAFVAGKAWEGWCTVLRPPELQLQCEAPKEAKPGARITITLKTNAAERVVPVQLIVKDQRLVAPSDPQVEFAACIKKNLHAWSEQSGTGEVDRQLAQLTRNRWSEARTRGVGGMRPMVAFASGTNPAPPPFQPFAVSAMAAPTPVSAPPQLDEAVFAHVSTPQATGALTTDTSAIMASSMQESMGAVAQKAARSVQISNSMLAKMRLQFPEIIHNTIVRVQGETSVEVKLGDGMTRYSIEAFALVPETMDWQRVESTLETMQPVYGELSVSPFVFPGDPVLGRLDVGAASGGAIVDVRHDGEALPLFFDNGEAVAPGLPIPSGSVLRFPVRPGAITSTVRDARKGGIDVSERYVTEPGKLRHIVRRLHLLTPGDEVTLHEPRRLEIQPLPGLERSFQVFVEGAVNYPFGCIEQTSMKVVSMYAGYITNREHEERARDYEAAILVWHKRLKSMYLPNSGFCFYPPEEGGDRKPDTHYAPLGVKHLLMLPSAERSGIQAQALREILDDIHAMVRDAAAYYKIDNPPKELTNCHAAYQVLVQNSAQADRDKAAAFVRSRLPEHDGQIYVDMSADQAAYPLYGKAVSTRAETAYAAAALLVTREQADLPKAIAATNYLTSQMNEEGRLYSTIDTAACLALLLALRETGVVAANGKGRVVLNGQEMPLAEALTYSGKVESLRCLDGVVAAQITSEVIEDWRTFKSELPVTVRLERSGQVQERFKIGDALDLVIRVPRYEPGLLAHVCLPDALARVVGGGQVKRFSLDFCERNELRVPLAAVGSTVLPTRDEQVRRNLLPWPGAKKDAAHGQHWAVIVRNMFKEEQVGNPGLLQVIVE